MNHHSKDKNAKYSDMNKNNKKNITLLCTIIRAKYYIDEFIHQGIDEEYK